MPTRTYLLIILLMPLLLWGKPRTNTCTCKTEKKSISARPASSDNFTLKGSFVNFP